MTSNRGHYRPIDGVEGLFEVHKGDNQWKFVVSKAFHDSSQSMGFLGAAAQWTKTCLVLS